MERVVVYIDGANFYGGIFSINPKYTDTKFDFERYINKIVGNRQLMFVKYYNASLKQQINPEIFKKQQRLFSRLRKIKNCEVILSKRKPRLDTEGKEYHTIKGDDINLALDMLEDAYENKYDTAILISSDGDFVSLVRKVKHKGKKIELHYFANCISNELLNEATYSKMIDKKILKKFFYRETDKKTKAKSNETKMRQQKRE